MRPSHAAATIGHISLAEMARWCVMTRSKSGAETTAETMPERIRAAPKRPESVSLYPTGFTSSLVRMENESTLAHGTSSKFIRDSTTALLTGLPDN